MVEKNITIPCFDTSYDLSDEEKKESINKLKSMFNSDFKQEDIPIKLKIIFEEKPIIYLYSPIRITAIRKKIKNIFPTPLGGLIHNLDEIYIDNGEVK